MISVPFRNRTNRRWSKSNLSKPMRHFLFGALLLFLGCIYENNEFTRRIDVLLTDENSAQLPESSYTWDTRLALKRATEPLPPRDLAVPANNLGDHFQVQDDPNTPSKSVAVMSQVNDLNLWQDILKCTANVAAAAAMKNYMVDVYISFQNEETDTPEASQKLKFDQIKSFHNVNNVYFDYTANIGPDIQMFLSQLEHMTENNYNYDYIIKQNTEADESWRLRHIECLCGTPEQVISIWDQTDKDEKLGFVAPHGTYLKHDSETKSISPIVADKFFQGVPSVKNAFNPILVEKVQLMHNQIRDNNHSPWKDSSLSLIAGNVFWAKSEALHPMNLIKAKSKNIEETFDWMNSDQQGHEIELVLQRLIVSYAVNDGWKVAEAIPAPRVFPLYFPQYHQFEENDEFWGKGFTEWTLLKPLEVEGIKKPLPVEEGGLGYYNLMEKEVRERQADLARRSGISGFVYYHYWFSGPKSPKRHKVMYKVLEQMLADGEPDMPFMLSWANEPWSRRWSGATNANGDVLLSQEYGDRDDWISHFYYLHENFFTHPNYVWIGNKPVFIIYRLGHMADVLEQLLPLWDKLAKVEGMDGIHIIHTKGCFYDVDPQTRALEKNPLVDGAFHFMPFSEPPGPTASSTDLNLNVKEQYWGAYVGFDKTPRDPTYKSPFNVDGPAFVEGLQTSFKKLSDYTHRNIDYNFFFLTAWNEWNEQAVLEPDQIHKFDSLEILRDNLEQCPLHYVS